MRTTRDETPEPSRPPRRSVAVIALASAVVPALLLYACTDTPSAPSGPGDNLTDNSHQDAVATPTQDAAVSEVGPMGAGDGGYDGDLDASGASTGYMDVSSPQAACSSCKCDNRVAFCLENGTSYSVSGAGTAGSCAYAPANRLEIGCNILPAACAKNPTCACILDNVQPPLGCYPECSTSLGYIDVFCPHP